MAVNYTPPSRNVPQGLQLINTLNQLENSINSILAQIATTMETVDGGEPNANDPQKVTVTVATYGYTSNDAAVAAIGQLEAVRAVVSDGAGGMNLALKQAFNRLRG